MEREDREFQAFMDQLQSGALTYDDVKKRYLELGDQIRQRYEREYTAVSVDVVQSGLSKSAASDLDAQLTFDAYHNWIDQKLAVFGSRNFSWSGDGLLAVFEQPEEAVACARSIRDELSQFNAKHNRLHRALQVRIGIHTGTILHDNSEGLGKIASRTFDLAGHLQKSARPNQIRISETTYALLKEGAGQFVPDSAELPNPSAVFVYPADSAGAPYEPSYSGLPPTLAPAAPPKPSALPWIIAGVAGVVAIGVTVGVFLAHGPGAQNGSAAGGSGPNLQVIRPNQPANPESPAPSGSAGGSPGAPAPAIPASTGGTSAQPSTAPRAASPWEPSRAAWRSPDADSGVPARFSPPGPERKWLLAIGVGRYSDNAFSAEGAGGDARLVSGSLQRTLGVPGDHTRVLVDGQATQDGIKSAFQWLQQNAASGQDLVVVYLAGAAEAAPDRQPGQHSSGTGYAFIPADGCAKDLQNTTVYGVDIAEWLAATHSQTVLLVVDTPHAAMIDLPGGNDPGRLAALLAGSTAVQKTGKRTDRGASPFAECLTQGLSGLADMNGDGRISLNEIRSSLESNLPKASGYAQNFEARAGFGGFFPEILFGRG
jgi:class 3 adenylate cyclase